MAMNEQELQLAREIDTEFDSELRTEEDTVEALLFTMGNTVTLEQIATALNLGKTAAQEAVDRLIKRYDTQNGGVLIKRLEGKYQMCTNPKYYESLIRVAKQPKKPVLTDIVMETLSIIAYKQPVTKSEIEKIRGVSSDHAVNRLVEYGLAYEVGRLDAPGRPALFATTEDFLRRFGVSSLSELPGLDPEREEEIQSEVKEEVTELLGSAPIEEAEDEAEVEGTDAEGTDVEDTGAAGETDTEATDAEAADTDAAGETDTKATDAEAEAEGTDAANETDTEATDTDAADETLDKTDAEIIEEEINTSETAEVEIVEEEITEEQTGEQ